MADDRLDSRAARDTDFGFVITIAFTDISGSMAQSASFSVASMMLASAYRLCRFARQCSGVKHETAARRTTIGGEDRSFDAEPERRRRPSLVDEFDLGSAEEIELPVALDLLQPTALACTRKRRLDAA
ncbi:MULTISPECIES: hypothetical protein [unclassified Bradyrhizobium]|uniref:hypothetical protein n=1 Tax=unclassified Bradyrhizobium TaxID=2631580 RepID=UPI002916E898|nr:MULTISPECIES: hypothetical protein [unclassified Bradyrhizobium]